MHALQRYVFLLGIVFACSAFGQEPSLASTPRYVADIELETESDLSELLSRAGKLFLEGKVTQDQGAVVLVLHGPVLSERTWRDYSEYYGTCLYLFRRHLDTTA